MHQHLLICNDFALEVCASLQPNSPETGTSPVGGFKASRLSNLLAAPMRVARGVMCPIDGLAMDSLQGMGGITGRTGTLELNSFASGGKLGQAKWGGIMGKENRPADQGIGISSYNNGNINRLNTGSHSRHGGLPPLSRASAPPGRDSADPGGGPTAS